MLQENQVLSIEETLKGISGSIELFKRFARSLNAFLETNNLGTAELDTDLNSSHGEQGYDFARFELTEQSGTQVLYLYVYTNGTVSGENLSAGTSIECSWSEAIREILQAVGALKHSPLSQEKIEKAIAALEG